MTVPPFHVPARPPRDTRMDIVRGWLQLTIFMSHAFGSFIGGWFIHGAWGLSDSSEQFVLLSGFTLGSVFARKAARQGWRAGSADLLRRTLRLYRIHLLVVLLFGVMVTLAGMSRRFPDEAEGLGWGFMLTDPLRAIPAALTILYQPAFMGILPVFIWCMLLLPGFAALAARYGDRALLAAVALYAAAWLVPLWPPSLGPDTGIGFNPFAWQMLYLTGAWLGRRALYHGRALPRWRWGFAVAVPILLLGLALRLSWYGFAPWPALLPEDTLVTGKEGLAPLRVLHALALAWTVSMLLPRDADWMHRSLFRWLAAIGRHSLEVFCLGLFLSWGASAAFRLWPGHWWLDALLILAGFVALAAFGRMLDHRRMVHRPAVAA